MLGRALRSAQLGRHRPAVRRMGVSAPGSSGLAFPDGMNDSRYTSMTEVSSETFFDASTTYSKYSWLDHSNHTDQQASMRFYGNNTTLNDFRCKTREGVRINGHTGININWLYLEIYGLGEADHSDGVQWEGGANSNTYKNCHFRGTSGGYTCMFVADGATGTLTLEDCLFTNDGTDTHSGIIIYADAGFGTVQLSLKNCYFQETGWSSGAIDIQGVPGVTDAADVILWDNVRYCSWNHSTKVLTPGDLISQPSGT
jgi:hypothetical protein